MNRANRGNDGIVGLRAWSFALDGDATITHRAAGENGLSPCGGVLRRAAFWRANRKLGSDPNFIEGTQLEAIRLGCDELVNSGSDPTVLAFRCARFPSVRIRY